MKKVFMAVLVLSACVLSGCESLYYSAALDKPVYGKDEGEKFDRDAPDMLNRAGKY